MQNVALLYRGKHEHTTALKNDTEAIKGILDSDIWNCPTPKDISSIDTLIEDLKQFTEINNLLFYYTAHGYLAKDHTNFHFDFCEESFRDIDSIIDTIENTLNLNKLKKIIFIIDACYSGKAKEKIVTKCTDKSYAYEVLVSTPHDELCGVNKMGNISIFTQKIKDYCKETHNEITLQSLAYGIDMSELYAMGGAVSSILQKTFKEKSITQKYMDQIKGQSKSAEEIQHVLHVYLEYDGLYGIDIASITSLEQLVGSLAKIGSEPSLNILECVLDELLFNKETHCEKYALEVEDVFVFIKREGKETKKYSLTLYFKYKSGIYKKLLTDNDNKQGSILQKIIEQINSELDKITHTVERPNLVLVLPFELFRHDFKSDLNKKYTIVTKMYMRYDNYDADIDYIRHWKEKNAQREVSTKSLIGTMFTKDNLKGFTPRKGEYHYVVQDTCVLDESYMAKLFMSPIPYLLTPQNGTLGLAELCSKNWKNNIKVQEVEDYVKDLVDSEDETIHFLCDGGYDSQLLNQIGDTK